MKTTDPESGHGDRRHLFASGAPRSGTTLLQLVLSAHPRITISPETRVIGWLFRLRRDPRAPLSARDRDLLARWIRQDNKLRAWPGGGGEDIGAALRNRSDWTVESFLDQLFVSYAHRTGGGAAWLGNKRELFLAGYTSYTLDVFPEARFVAIVRDPRDVVRSIVSNLRRREIQEAATVCHVMGRHIADVRRRYPDRIHVVRYEDLVRAPEAECRALCAFLGEAYDPRMVTFHEINRDGALLIGSTRHIHPHTTEPFNPDLIGQWEKKAFFSPGELRMVESVAGDYLRQFGYEPVTDARPPRGLSAWRRDWAYCRQRYGRQIPRGPIHDGSESPPAT